MNISNPHIRTQEDLTIVEDIYQERIVCLHIYAGYERDEEGRGG